VQSLMQQRKVGALLIEAGASLEYFTGIRWWRLERTTAVVIPAEGGVIIVTPFFEEPSVRETLQVPGDVRPWKEDASPFDLLASVIRERAGAGPLAVEGTTRFFIIDQVRKALGSSRDVVAGDSLVRACREIKSPAELALMQAANDVTISALRHVHGQISVGMTAGDIEKKLVEATTALGGTHDFALVLRSTKGKGGGRITRYRGHHIGRGMGSGWRCMRRRISCGMTRRRWRRGCVFRMSPGFMCRGSLG
jgi:Xaa-Pro dipeptidase